MAIYYVYIYIYIYLMLATHWAKRCYITSVVFFLSGASIFIIHSKNYYYMAHGFKLFIPILEILEIELYISPMILEMLEISISQFL